MTDTTTTAAGGGGTIITHTNPPTTTTSSAGVTQTNPPETTRTGSGDDDEDEEDVWDAFLELDDDGGDVGRFCSRNGALGSGNWLANRRTLQESRSKQQQQLFPSDKKELYALKPPIVKKKLNIQQYAHTAPLPSSAMSKTGEFGDFMKTPAVKPQRARFTDHGSGSLDMAGTTNTNEYGSTVLIPSSYLMGSWSSANYNKNNYNSAIAMREPRKATDPLLQKKLKYVGRK